MLVQRHANAASRGLQHRCPSLGICRVRKKLSSSPVTPRRYLLQQDEKDNLHAVAREHPCTVKVTNAALRSTEINPELVECVYKFIRRGDYP